MKTIKLSIIGLLLSVNSFGQSFDQRLNDAISTSVNNFVYDKSESSVKNVIMPTTHLLKNDDVVEIFELNRSDIKLKSSGFIKSKRARILVDCLKFNESITRKDDVHITVMDVNIVGLGKGTITIFHTGEIIFNNNGKMPKNVLNIMIKDNIQTTFISFK